MDKLPSMIPDEYVSKLDYFETQMGIKFVKDIFEKKLADKLHLQRISAPRFLVVGDGLQDDLAGTQVPVGFSTKFLSKPVEVVHSLAKWKRYVLGKRGFRIGTGLYTDMDAIRKDEDVDEIHSIYVDQWDWELVITKEQRTLDFLKGVVKKIYEAILEIEQELSLDFPILKSRLPNDIVFIHSEELEKSYPDMTPKQREDAIAKKHGAIFIIGIGHPLKSGKPHDVRAADYDDWFTETEYGRGLNGDLIVWDSVREKSLELSSMGIRVDAESLLEQLKLMGSEDRMVLEYHDAVLDGSLPFSIGGGIGQSRLCMFLLQKAHIGEVHSSVWPDDIVQECESKGVVLL